MGCVACGIMTRKQASPLQGTVCGLGDAMVHFNVTTLWFLPYSMGGLVRGRSRCTKWVRVGVQRLRLGLGRVFRFGGWVGL